MLPFGRNDYSIRHRKAKQSKYITLMNDITPNSTNNTLLNSIFKKYLSLRHTEFISVSHKIDEILKQVQKDDRNVFINQYFNNRVQVISIIYTIIAFSFAKIEKFPKNEYPTVNDTTTVHF